MAPAQPCKNTSDQLANSIADATSYRCPFAGDDSFQYRTPAGKPQHGGFFTGRNGQ